jgi:hypothetical protein
VSVIVALACPNEPLADATQVGHPSARASGLQASNIAEANLFGDGK